MTKKTLLAFHPALAPYRVDLFNLLAENFEMELALFDANLVNQKFDQTKLISRLKCAVSYLTHGFRWKDRYFRTGAFRKIWSYRPDVVLISEFGPVALSIVLYKLLFRPRFQLYTMTDDNAFQFKARRGLKAVLLKLFMKVLDGFLVANEETKSCYQRITPPGKAMLCVTIPIVHTFESIRNGEAEILAHAAALREEHIGGHDKIVLFVGRLDPVKNLEWLVDWIGRKRDGLMAAGWKVKWLFVGDGHLRKNLTDAVGKFHLGDDVQFVGRREGRGVYELMAMADVLVLPSTFEPFGAVVGEALHWGTPCLVSDHVGAKALIKDADQGATFRFDDGDDMLNKLVGILRLTPEHAKSLLRVNLEDAVGEFVAGVYCHA